MDTNNNLPEEPFGQLVDELVAPLKRIIDGVPKILKFDFVLPRLTSITDIGGQGVKMKWPPETVRLMRLLPKEGIFLTGIESADPWVEGVRRNQLKEAFDFELNYEQRLERIRALGIKWLRFGPAYSQTHAGPDQYDFMLMDKVVAKCDELGINILADLLHFGLPEWLHEQNPDQPFFQNSGFAERFVEYVTEFARRYPSVRFFTMVNEPMVTAFLSAKAGLWNEQIGSEWQDDKTFVRAAANIARAAILGRQAIEQVWQDTDRKGTPLFLQNESFEAAVPAPGSQREAEARRFNLRRFVGLDLIFGHYDPVMEQYLIEQGLSEQDHQWFMANGTTEKTILGIDHYPWCIHTLEADRNVDNTPSQPYQLYDLVKIYWQRYLLPLLHTEVNGQAEFAERLCRETYDTMARLSQEGYPIVGMGWYGDEYQVGWQALLTPRFGPHLEEYQVGLHYRGEPQPVAFLFQRLAAQGLPEREKGWAKSLRMPVKLIKKIGGINPPS